MRIDRVQMKQEARLSMRDHRPSVYPVVLVLLVILYVTDLLSLKLQYPGLSLGDIMSYSEDMLQKLAAASRNRSLFAVLLGLAISVIVTVINAGFIGYSLNVSRRLEAGLGDLFDTFGIFFKVLWLQILIVVFTFLWTLLLIVPGIIASYRYYMALYILLDDPDKSALQCIRESKEMTSGYKGQLFVMELSFLGWVLLSTIPFVSIYTLPYMGITRANFYRAISGQTEAPESALCRRQGSMRDGGPED